MEKRGCENCGNVQCSESSIAFNWDECVESQFRSHWIPKLKPCPFCGGNAKVSIAKAPIMLKKFQGVFVGVYCPKCGASTLLINRNNKTRSPLINSANAHEAELKAVELWNKRAKDGEQE